MVAVKTVPVNAGDTMPREKVKNECDHLEVILAWLTKASGFGLFCLIPTEAVVIAAHKAPCQ